MRGGVCWVTRSARSRTSIEGERIERGGYTARRRRREVVGQDDIWAWRTKSQEVEHLKTTELPHDFGATSTTRKKAVDVPGSHYPRAAEQHTTARVRKQHSPPPPPHPLNRPLSSLSLPLSFSTHFPAPHHQLPRAAGFHHQLAPPPPRRRCSNVQFPPAQFTLPRPAAAAQARGSAPTSRVKRMYCISPKASARKLKKPASTFRYCAPE